ncbi:unnamed protein product [Protopolystoma xenopodis]|uniref:Uncharacterized protein n=1 Tax=Protopolystoma xenopodis TaxID=117903 RepID=A0A448WTZ1_9PLAT|nr:unnamed protein product [Protopolystoma xenopodis]
MSRQRRPPGVHLFGQLTEGSKTKVAGLGVKMWSRNMVWWKASDWRQRIGPFVFETRDKQRRWREASQITCASSS